MAEPSVVGAPAVGAEFVETIIRDSLLEGIAIRLARATLPDIIAAWEALRPSPSTPQLRP